MARNTNKGEDPGWSNILGIVFLSLGLLLLAALISYDSGDLSINKVPPNSTPHNWIGRFGAWASYGSFFVFGAAAFLLPILCAFYGLAHFLPIMTYLLHSWRARIAAAGLLFSCMGVLDLYSEPLVGLRSAFNSKGAGGLIGYILNHYFFVYFFNRTGAMMLYLTFYFTSLVALTDFDVGGWLREGWERYQDRRERLDRNASREEKALRRRARSLGRKAQKLEEETRRSAIGADLRPVPEPKVRDLSIRGSVESSPDEPPMPLEAPSKNPFRSHARPGRPSIHEEHASEVSPPSESKTNVPHDSPDSQPGPEAEPPGKARKANEAVLAPTPIREPSSSGKRRAKGKAPLRVAAPPLIGDYQLPDLRHLHLPESNRGKRATKDDLLADARLMQNTLAQFGIEVSLGDITRGPTITRYELHPAPGIKLERIANLSNNIAAALKAERIHILAPVPGKSSVGIEVPNLVKTKVVMRDLLESSEWKSSKERIPLALGKDVYGKPITADLGEMPHLLIAGSTGSGKSVCINAIIASLLYRFSPDELRFVMIDPKVVELQQYNALPHLVVPVVTDPKKVVLALRWVVHEMEKRYQIFAKVGVRNIKSFNRRPRDRPEPPSQPELPLSLKKENAEANTEGFAVELDQEIVVPRDDDVDIPEKLSYIVVVIDELADLMLVAPSEVEMAIARITQMARAAGIHCVIATQRPSVDVITGVIKANIPARIAFQVASKVDSRTILDAMGADKLLGQGDMLYLPPGSGRLVRAQGVLITDEEIQGIVNHIAQQGKPSYEVEIHEQLSRPSPQREENGRDEDEALIEKCLEIIRSEQKASVSLMQRRLRLGYTRAARIMDELENRGVVGPSKGAEPREILIDLDGTGADGKGQGLPDP